MDADTIEALAAEGQRNREAAAMTYDSLRAWAECAEELLTHEMCERQEACAQLAEKSARLEEVEESLKRTEETAIACTHGIASVQHERSLAHKEVARLEDMIRKALRALNNGKDYTPIRILTEALVKVQKWPLAKIPYGQVLSERDQLRAQLAASQAENKRVEEVLTHLGGDYEDGEDAAERINRLYEAREQYAKRLDVSLEQVDELLAKLAASQALCEKRGQALVDVEWANYDDFDDPCCPQCCALKQDGHQPNCALKAALTATPTEALKEFGKEFHFEGYCQGNSDTDNDCIDSERAWQQSETRKRLGGEA